MLCLIAAVPLAEALLLLIGLLTGIERNKRLPAAALIGIVVIGCHALALVLWPGLYGSEPPIVHHGGAWVAWAGISPILCAWYAAEKY